MAKSFKDVGQDTPVLSMEYNHHKLPKAIDDFQQHFSSN